MNKKMILLTALIAATPVLQVAASVDAMYYDIKGIVEDRLTGKDDHERLNNVQNALRQVRCYKEDMQRVIIAEHARIDRDKIAGLAFGALSGVFFGASAINYYADILTKADTGALAALGLMCTAVSVFGLCKKTVDLYYNKKKITELNAVIIRLETMEKALMQKLYPHGYCTY